MVVLIVNQYGDYPLDRTNKGMGPVCPVVTTPEDCLDALHEAIQWRNEPSLKAQFEEIGLQSAPPATIRQMGG